MYQKTLKKMLTPSRLYHSYCVSDQAQHLAKIFGANEKKAKIAGLLHDITKSLPTDKQLKIINEAGFKLDEIQRVSPKLLHSISGAFYIKKFLDIKDDEIISAIRYHTTAKPKMTLLEKIVYLADYTSLDRKFVDAAYMREIVEKSLDDGMKYGLTYTIRDLIDKSVAIHPDTFLAYNYYIK